MSFLAWRICLCAWYDKRKGQQADLISLFLVEKMPQEVAYFLQIRNAVKVMCGKMCIFKDIAFK